MAAVTYHWRLAGAATGLQDGSSEVNAFITIDQWNTQLASEASNDVTIKAYGTDNTSETVSAKVTLDVDGLASLVVEAAAGYLPVNDKPQLRIHSAQTAGTLTTNASSGSMEVVFRNFIIENTSATANADVIDNFPRAYNTDEGPLFDGCIIKNAGDEPPIQTDAARFHNTVIIKSDTGGAPVISSNSGFNGQFEFLNSVLVNKGTAGFYNPVNSGNTCVTYNTAWVADNAVVMDVDGTSTWSGTGNAKTSTVTTESGVTMATGAQTLTQTDADDFHSPSTDDWFAYAGGELDGNGTGGQGTSTDINGDTRDGSTPDIGPLELSGTDTDPPDVPNAPTEDSKTSTTATMSTNTVTDNGGGSVVGYRWYRDTVFQEQTASPTSWTDSGPLTPSTEYDYTVSAIDNSSNESAQSGITAITTAADTDAPNVPNAPTEDSTTSTTATMSTSAVSDIGGGSVVGYRWYRDTIFQEQTASPTSWTDDGPLVPLTSYDYTVSAIDDSSNESAQSGITAITTAADTDAPNVPNAPTEDSTTSTTATMSTSAVSDVGGGSVVGYRWYRNTVFQEQTASPTSWTDSGPLTPSTSYDYTVSAIDDSSNESAQSGITPIITLSDVDTDPPTIPTGLASSNITNKSITMVWGPSTDVGGGSVAGYKLRMNGGVVYDGPLLEYEIDNREAETQYSFTIAAYDDVFPPNESAESSAVLVTTRAEFDFTWVDTTAQAGTQYTYQVEAVDNVGGIGPPSSDTVTTPDPPADSTPPTTPTTAPILT